jgi:epoxyqueuosine reductase QueG
LEGLAREAGADLFGVADIEPFRDTFHSSLRDMSGGLDRALSMGVRLSEAIIDGIVDRPTLIYKHHYKAVNYALDQIALQVSSGLRRAGWRALPIPASQLVDWDAHRGHLSHRLVAWEAGLGWIGRSSLLVNLTHGARIRLVTVLTDAPLLTDTPAEGDCGSCRRCMEACPAGAISERGYDLRACLAKLDEFASMRGIGVHICGVCVKACPVEPPRPIPARGERANHPPPQSPWVKCRNGREGKGEKVEE